MSSLTLKHKRDAIIIGNSVARQLARLVRGATPDLIDQWWEENEDQALTIVQSGFNASRQTAIEYLLATANERELTLDGLTEALFNVEQTLTSLRVTGPVAFKIAMRETRNPLAAKKIMLTRFTASGQRLALAGGRNTIFETSKNSTSIVGYRRVSDGAPCEFCAMLTGRGAVYGEFSGQFEAHDGDGCSLEPVFK